MNIHALIDQAVLNVMSLVVGKNKFFADSVTSVGMDALIKDIKIRIPEIMLRNIYKLQVDTPAGKLSTGFKIFRWKGEEYPTIIFHHGSNEKPFGEGPFVKNCYYHILMSGKKFRDVNIIGIMAPYHDRNSRNYMEAMGSLENFVTMLIVSVNLIEKLILYFKNSTENIIAVTGISLGGWICNLHKIYYDSADLYIPIMAGAALDKLFLDSAYRRVTGEKALNDHEAVSSLLNFEDKYDLTDQENVHPILALHDRYCEFSVQKKCYRKVNVINRGHVTGAASYGLIGNYINSVLNNYLPHRA